MLLETLDIKKNDVVIFSRNIFDLEKNFKIIYKDDPKKAPHKISYKEVCRFVNEFTPKNIIVYRLLTNIQDFEIYLSKYGIYLSINNITELIYFDPVFAIKELEDYSEAINYYDLRFRIQQVGLTTLNRKGNLPNYAEIYNIDLEASEAKFQNDMAFAQAIFAFAGKNNNDEKELSEKAADKKPFLKEPEREEQKSADKTGAEKNILRENKPAPQTIKTEAVKPVEGNGEKPFKKKLIKKEVSTGEKFETVNNIDSGKYIKDKKEDAKEKKTEPEEKVKHINSPQPEMNIEPPEISTPKDSVMQPKVNENNSSGTIEGIKIIKHDISKDEEFDYKQIMRINFKGTAGIKKEPSISKNDKQESVRENTGEAAGVVPRLIKHNGEVRKTFASVLKSQNTPAGSAKTSKTGEEEKSSMIIDIFKSPASLKNYLTGRENKKVVLKMNKK